MLFPVLGFFDQSFFQYSLVSDHWQYYSIVGAIALVVAPVAAIGRRVDQPGRAVGVVAGVAVLLMLGVDTWTRAGVYGTAETLWRDTLTKNSNAWIAYNNLGTVLRRTGRVQEAIEQYEQALRIRPDYAEAHNNLAVALANQGRVQGAIEHYEQALRIRPEYAAAHNNLGGAFANQGKFREAIEQYEQALRIRPDYAEAHANLGNALQRVGRVQDAIGHYERAVQIAPGSAEFQYVLGSALEQAGRRPEAIAHYEQAVLINPDYVEAQNKLAELLATPPPAGVTSPSNP
jgi:tetratricopeptide (TPR) repeat protein